MWLIVTEQIRRCQSGRYTRVSDDLDGFQLPTRVCAAKPSILTEKRKQSAVSAQQENACIRFSTWNIGHMNQWNCEKKTKNIVLQDFIWQNKASFYFCHKFPFQNKEFPESDWNWVT